MQPTGYRQFPSPLSASPTGGAEEARTPDPLVANQVLSQLSYSPESQLQNGHKKEKQTALLVSMPKISEFEFVILSSIKKRTVPEEG